MSTTPAAPNFSQRLTETLSQRSDLVVAVMVVAIVAMMIVPLPTALLDVLLAGNLAMATTVLLTSLYVHDAAALASLPSVLLLTTLFRLGLNVSTTRLILLQADAGRVVEAFGEFVVAGNHVVGVVIFGILTVVQFVVIARGAERVAEVAARFSLDAMPGQQMSIDADLRAGALSHDQAVAARAALSRRSRLYGALDGAMKFVKGDAIAGVVIIAINIVAGLIVGVVQRDMTLGEAAQRYTLLTIGDGLVSQIPALLIAMGAGMVVTRVDGERPGHLGQDIATQFGRHPRALWIGGGLLAALAVVPGLPALPFLALAAASVGLGWIASRRPAPKEAAPATAVVRAEVGADLLVYLGADGVARLDEALGREGERLSRELGLPPLAVHRAPTDERGWRLALSFEGLTVATLNTDLRERAAVRGDLTVLRTRGIEPIDTVLDESLAWVPRADLSALADAGLAPLTDVDALVTLIRYTLRGRAERLLTFTATHQLLADVERHHRALVKAQPLDLPTLTQLLRRLLRERVPVKALPRILEAVATTPPDQRPLSRLTEAVRASLAPTLAEPFVGPDRRLRALLVDRAVEQMIRGGVKGTAGADPSLELPLDIRRQIRAGARLAIDEEVPLGQWPVLLTDADVRPHLAALLQGDCPDAVILSFDDLADDVRVEPSGRVRAARQA